MPYPSTHKQETRERIIQSAAKLFMRQGFDKVSIDGVMADAGLTRGAFYSHFADKGSLYVEAITYAAQHRFSKYTHDLQTNGGMPMLLNAYLSREHIEQETTPCPLAFLATDVSQRDPQVRSAYTHIYQNMVKRLPKLGNGHPDRAACLAATAMMIGGVAIGRALDDEVTVDELLAACRKFALELLDTGWAQVENPVVKP